MSESGVTLRLAISNERIGADERKSQGDPSSQFGLLAETLIYDPRDGIFNAHPNRFIAGTWQQQPSF